MPSTTAPGDPRVRRTRTALARALIQLVAEHDLSRVTVADVALRAGVSRSTFYDHYRDVHDLAEAACTTMIDDLIESLPAPRHDTPDPAPEAARSLEEFFSSLAGHAGLYRALLGPEGSARVADHIRRRCTASIQNALDGVGIPPDERDVHAAFTAGALIGVAADWLQRGCPRTPAEMATLTWPLISALYHLDDA